MAIHKSSWNIEHNNLTAMLKISSEYSQYTPHGMFVQRVIHILPVTKGFPSQRASNAQSVFMPWRRQLFDIKINS